MTSPETRDEKRARWEREDALMERVAAVFGVDLADEPKGIYHGNGQLVLSLDRAEALVALAEKVGPKERESKTS